MKKDFYLKRVFFLAIFFSLFSIAYSLDVQITITEDSKLTSLLAGGYSLDATGTLKIYNPSNFSRIYELDIPITLDALIGVSGGGSSKLSLTYEGVEGYMIDPKETVSLNYRIYGLLNYDIHELTAQDGITVFEYYADSYDLQGNAIMNLQKVQREGSTYFINGSLEKSVNTTNSSRVVAAGVRNPTDLNFFAKEMRLYKTSVGDPFFSDGILVDTRSNLSIAPFELREFDFYDKNSNDQSVYWISSEVFIETELVSYPSRENLIQVIKKASNSGGGFPIRLNNSGGDDIVIDPLILKKEVDKTLIHGGDEVEVILRIVNVNDFELEDLELYDEVPEGYEIKDVSTSVKIDEGGLLKFDVERIGAYDTYIIKYKLVNNNDLKGITYLKPAKLIFQKDSFYSEGVLLINDLLPNKKVFVQKEIEYVDDEFARVTIKVKNLGSLTLENLLVSDIIDENAIMREISEAFEERGIWKIKLLKAGEEWKVTYLVERNSQLDNLPNVFGVEKSNVFGTLVSSEEIVTVFNEEPRTIEKVGLGLAIGLLIFYILF